MINCIYVDPDKESRETVAPLIRKISGLCLRRTYANFEIAEKACLENNINILFIFLHDFPAVKNKISSLIKIAKHGTQIIVIFSRIGVAGEAYSLNVADVIMFPTTTKRLWQACTRALKVINQGGDMPKMKMGNLYDHRISLTN